MKKTTMALAFGLALSAGAGALQAQAPGQGGNGRGGQHGQFEGRRGRRPERMLLKGIKLSADQKAQLKTLVEKERAERGKDAPNRQAFEDIRALRQKGDTAAARARMQEVRASMEKERGEHVAQVRAILTPDQQKQFDANLAQMKQRMARRGQNGGPGWAGRRGGAKGNGQGRRPGGTK